jgi:hypothetical protein
MIIFFQVLHRRFSGEGYLQTLSNILDCHLVAFTVLLGSIFQ